MFMFILFTHCRHTATINFQRWTAPLIKKKKKKKRRRVGRPSDRLELKVCKRCTGGFLRLAQCGALHVGVGMADHTPPTRVATRITLPLRVSLCLQARTERSTPGACLSISGEILSGRASSYPPFVMRYRLRKERSNS